MDNKNPTVKINPRDVYVEQTNLPDPYNWYDLVQIAATDFNGNNIPLDNNHFLLDTSKVDFSHIGVYFVSVSVMDDLANMSLDYIKVHVLSPEETERINGQADLEENNQHKEQRHKKNKKKNSLENTLFGHRLLPKDEEERIRYSSDLPSLDEDDDENSNHIWDKVSRWMIAGLAVVTVITLLYFFKGMFF